MNNTYQDTEDQATAKVRPPAASHRTLLALLWLACLYLWLLPLLRPRGAYLWGHFTLHSLLLGVPLALATLAATTVCCCPLPLRRVVALRLTSLSLSLLFGFALFDLVDTFGFRMVWRPNVWRDDSGVDLRYDQLDPELGWKRKPGILSPQRNAEVGPGDRSRYVRNLFYQTDEHGFRNPPGLLHADFVFLGDSYTEATDVPAADTFVQRVAQATGRSAVNLGVAGYCPPQELLTLRRFGLPYQPRFVVWQIFGGNDLKEADRFPGWIAQPCQSTRTTLISRYRRDSPLMRLLDRTILLEPSKQYGAFLHQSDGRTVPLDILGVYSPDLPEKYPLGWAETQRAVEQGYRLCRSRGIQLLVLFVPTREQVLAPWIEFASEKARRRSLPGGVWEDERDFGHRLGAFCQRLGCAYQDSLPALRARAEEENRYLYFPMNHHFDRDGHEVVAQLVLAWLRRVEPGVAVRPSGARPP
jgi:GDSL-like lipase/acylhydrolase family protein